MSECNGLKIKALNQDCNRIAVKSSVQTSWNMTFKKHLFSKPQEYEIGMNRDELLVVAFQDGSGAAEVEITPLGDAVGTVIAQSSRQAARTLRVGSKYRWTLAPGESVIFRSNQMVDKEGVRVRNF